MTNDDCFYLKWLVARMQYESFLYFVGALDTYCIARTDFFVRTYFDGLTFGRRNLFSLG